MKSGNQANGTGGTNGKLKVFDKTAGIVEPGQGTLHDPSCGQNLPFRFDAHRGINAKARFAENMIKYIKMTASSNFGNMFSVLAASALLPFLPMMSLHLIFQNLIYDLSCTAIPWDNVDEEFLRVPRKWDASSVGSFMIWIKPTSSIFDFTTYIFMYFVFCPIFVSGGVLYNDPPSRFSGAALEQMQTACAAMFRAADSADLYRSVLARSARRRRSGTACRLPEREKSSTPSSCSRERTGVVKKSWVTEANWRNARHWARGCRAGPLCLRASLILRYNGKPLSSQFSAREAKRQKNALVSAETRAFLGGDYWTRTSGLLRVKQAL